jgi:hypothetical protein
MLEEQAVNMVEKAAEVAKDNGILTKENGIKVLAVIGAGTVVYGGYKLAMKGVDMFKNRNCGEQETEEKSA